MVSLSSQDISLLHIPNPCTLLSTSPLKFITLITLAAPLLLPINLPLSGFLLLSTPTSNPSSSPYHLTSKILTFLRSFATPPSLQYPAFHHWCHLPVHQHPPYSWRLCPWEVPIQRPSCPATHFLVSLTHFILTTTVSPLTPSINLRLRLRRL